MNCDGYGLSPAAVHHFSLSGTDLLITVDNGINARAAVLLARRLGIDVVVIDHHRIQEQAETLAVWSPEFCGAPVWLPCLPGHWQLEGCSQYAAIASIADCVPLLHGTRTLAKLGLGQLAHVKHCGLRERRREDVHGAGAGPGSQDKDNPGDVPFAHRKEVGPGSDQDHSFRSHAFD
jgi:single-stranded-DNA-specific exonuclease